MKELPISSVSFIIIGLIDVDLFSSTLDVDFVKNVFCRFVAVEKIKEQLLESNKQTYWVPEYVKVLIFALFYFLNMSGVCTSQLHRQLYYFKDSWAIQKVQKMI